MNNNLKNHYKNVIKYDLITRFNYKNIFEIPQINQIYLNIGFKNVNIEKKKLINLILLLKLITNQNPTVTKSKKNNILLKIKKNSIVGCKVTLHKRNYFFFLEKLVLFIIPNIEKIKLKKNNILSFQIKNLLNFLELKNEFIKFKNLPPIDVTINTNSKKKKDLFILLNYFFILKK